jgi:hypothetical protein
MTMAVVVSRNKFHHASSRPARSRVRQGQHAVGGGGAHGEDGGLHRRRDARARRAEPRALANARARVGHAKASRCLCDGDWASPKPSSCSQTAGSSTAASRMAACGHSLYDRELYKAA